MNVYLRQADEFFGRFFRFGGSMALFLKLLGDDELMKFVVEAANQKADANPFEQTVEEQLAAFRAQNEAGGWGVTEETFTRLAETAPAWPRGKDAYRSLRIRFGDGRNGMIKTFEAHSAAIKRVHGEAKIWRWEFLLSGEHSYQGKPVDRLRLLNGNQSHHAVVEWVVISDLSANRKRKDITSVRGPKSLADEGLVLAWLNPKRVKATDCKEWCAWFCAGYESNVPESDGEPWHRVPCVYFNRDYRKVELGARWYDYSSDSLAVPVFGIRYKNVGFFNPIS